MKSNVKFNQDGTVTIENWAMTEQQKIELVFGEFVQNLTSGGTVYCDLCNQIIDSASNPSLRLGRHENGDPVVLAACNQCVDSLVSDDSSPRDECQEDTNDRALQVTEIGEIMRHARIESDLQWVEDCPQCGGTGSDSNDFACAVCCGEGYLARYSIDLWNLFNELGIQPDWLEVMQAMHRVAARQKAERETPKTTIAWNEMTEYFDTIEF